LFLNKRNILIADEIQQNGSLDHVAVYPRDLLRRALILNASSIILVHNHPSGDPTPSPSDFSMTQRIVEMAKPLGIHVLDHLIISRRQHVSFRQRGLLREAV
jgi:DNA repair protein RadC